jgi:hypothetical protein
MSGAVPPFPNTPSWRGVRLKERTRWELLFSTHRSVHCWGLGRRTDGQTSPQPEFRSYCEVELSHLNKARGNKGQESLSGGRRVRTKNGILFSQKEQNGVQWLNYSRITWTCVQHQNYIFVRSSSATSVNSVL